MSLRRGIAGAAALAMVMWQMPSANAFRLTMSGYNTLTFRHNSVSGAAAGQTAFTYSNYERQRLFENNAGLNLTLQPFNSNRVLLNANVNSNRFSPDRSRYSLEYRGNGLNVTAGDISAGLAGNEFAPFHKSLRGLKVDGTWGKLGLSTILSEERAQVATDVFAGNNSPGPYTLRYSPIIDGTEQVRVDGQPKKFGVDYTIQYDTGILMFQTSDQTAIIPATSTIEVSYEYAGYGSSPGILAGMRAQLPVGDLGQFGITYISQMSRLKGSDGPNANRHTDQFIGNNTPMVLYLRYRPVSQITSVMVDGVPQTENVDYQVQSLDAGVIAFLRVVPAPAGSILDAPANVVVEYEVADTAAQTGAQGDKSIVGLDGQVKLGSAATLGVQFARSGGDASRSGNALSLRGSAELGSFTLGLNFRDVGQRFSAIESVGFQQRERALDGQLEFRATDHVRFTGRLGSTVRPNTGYWGYTGTGTSTTDQTTAAADAVIRGLTGNFGVSVNYPKLPLMDVTHQWYRTNGPQTSTGSGITDLRLSYKVGSAINLGANFNRNANQDLAHAGAGATSFTQRYTASFTPGSRFVVQADYSNSSLSSRLQPTSSTPATTDTTDTTDDTASELTVSSNRATTANLTMTWSPITIATLTASVRISDSGAGGTGGYYGGSGSYGNSYYSGGYLNSGNYGYGDSYTGSYYTPGSTSSSLYGGTSGTGTYSPTTAYSSTTGTGLSSTIPGATDIRSRQDATTDTTTDTTSTTDTTTDATDTTATTTDTTTNTNTRIRSINRTIGLQVNPIDRLSLMLNFSSDLQEGQYTSSNSTSTSTGLGFTWSPWQDRLSFNGQLSRQNYRFLGAGGDSGSTIAFGGVQMGFFRPFTLSLNYHAMTTSTGIPSLAGLGYTGITGTTGTTGTYPTGYPTGYSTTGTTGATTYATRMNTISTRLEYPISNSRKLFTTLEHSRVRGGGTYGTESGPENSRRLTAALGVELSLTRNLSWTMDVRRIHFADSNNPQRDYRGNLVTGEMKASF